MSTTFEWSPYLSQLYYGLIVAMAVVVILFAFLRKMRDFAWRAVFLALLALVLLNPIVLNEIRQGLPDKLVIVVDDSASQIFGGRDKVAAMAVEHIKAALAREKNIEPVIIHSGATSDGDESTDLFEVLRDNMASIPSSQVAGTVFVTDGQVHDVPKDLGALARLGPFHTVLTGTKDEFDRKVTVVSAPKYGVLNEDIRIKIRLDVFGRKAQGATTMTVRQDGQTVAPVAIAAGQEKEMVFRVAHSGQNIFEFVIPPEEGELSKTNNTTAVIVNGIRDRMRVLLVSGNPHMGERAWRNLLKSDPSVDLVHFTILRYLDSRPYDPTPTSQLSLVDFPVDELFRKKIKDFDLIILDRFQNQNYIMPSAYFSSIAGYIRGGGALLMALGTADTKWRQPTGVLLNSEVDGVLPVMRMNGESLRYPFRPELTQLGKRHPITADLMRQFPADHAWGQWYAQADVHHSRGQSLMNGLNDKPLLVIDKVGMGRVAVLTSDNVWLWGKSMGQEGPYTEMLRNVAHWLMKEPELEDDFIKAEAKGRTITVSQRDLTPGEKKVLMTTPSGKQELVAMSDKTPGWIRAHVVARESGIYSFDNGVKKAFVVIGAAINQEFADVHTTEEKMLPVTEATQGAMIWFQENQDFELRNAKPDTRILGGSDWMGMKRNEAYTIDNIESLSLLPNALSLLLIIAGILWAWWRESGAR